MIQINENFLDASLVRSGDKLTLGLTGDQPLEELLAMLNPETAPEIRVLDDEGGTVAIYRGHALTAVTIEPGEPRRITATLQVQPIEQSDADKLYEELARLKTIVEEHEAALVEVADVAAESKQIGEESQAALIELADMMTADNNGGEGTDNGGDLSAADQSGKTDA